MTIGISSDEDAGEQGDDESVAGSIILPMKRKYAAGRVQDRSAPWGTYMIFETPENSFLNPKQ